MAWKFWNIRAIIEALLAKHPEVYTRKKSPRSTLMLSGDSIIVFPLPSGLMPAG